MCDAFDKHCLLSLPFPHTVIYTRAAELAPFGTDLQSGRPPLKQQSDPPGNPTERDQPSVGLLASTHHLGNFKRMQ